MSQRLRRFSGLMLTALLFLVALVPLREPRVPSSLPSARPDPAAFLERAGIAKQTWRSHPEEVGPDRERAFRAAIDAYKAVIQAFPDSPALLAEAWFRSGELLRTAGRDAEARRAFQAASAVESRATYTVRAVLELGHLERRAGRLTMALRHYDRVVVDARVMPALREQAGKWRARVQQELGRMDESYASLELLAYTAEDAGRRLWAFDRMARTHIARGDLEGAAGVLESCRTGLAARLSEQSPLGERLRRNLERMTSRSQLVLAVRERSSRREAAEKKIDNF